MHSKNEFNCKINLLEFQKVQWNFAARAALKAIWLLKQRVITVAIYKKSVPVPKGLNAWEMCKSNQLQNSSGNTKIYGKSQQNKNNFIGYECAILSLCVLRSLANCMILFVQRSPCFDEIAAFGENHGECGENIKLTEIHQPQWVLWFHK